MPAPTFVLNSGLAGLGSQATPMPRTEVTREEWVANTNAAWLGKNPASTAMLAGGAAVGLFGLYQLFTGGSKVTGGLLALVGGGLAAYQLYGMRDIDEFKVGSQPGVVPAYAVSNPVAAAEGRIG